MRKIICLLISTILTVSAVSVAFAGSGFFGAPPEGTPSIVNYGWEGLTLGALMGVSVGYLQYAHNKETSRIGKDAAYGALIGAGGGLVLGFSDAAKGKKGYGAIVLRDMHLGANLGLAVGGIVGVLQYSDDKDWHRVPKGLAWGYIGGSLTGLAIALFEGPILVNYSEQSVSHTVVFLSDSENNLYPGYQVFYRF